MHRWLFILRSNHSIASVWEIRDLALVLVSGYAFSYFARFQHRIVGMVALFWLLLLWLEGFQFLVFYLFLLLSYYLLAHAQAAHYRYKLGGFGFVALLCARGAGGTAEAVFIGAQALAVASCSYFFRNSKSPVASRVQLLLPPVLVFAGVFLNQGTYLGDGSAKSHLAAYLLFLQFSLRVLFHYLDLRDRQIRRELAIGDFFSQFSLIPDYFMCDWWFHPGQGVKYLADSYYREDRSKLIVKGVTSIAWGLLYLLISMPVTRYLFHLLTQALKYPTFEMNELYDLYLAHVPFTLLNFFLAALWGLLLTSYVLIGGLHLKVGLYRLFGFDIQSYTSYPWVATNLSEFWKRYGYHYVQLILRGFYLPLFLRLRNLNLRLRAYASAFYAVSIGQTLTLGCYMMDEHLQFPYWLPYPPILAIGIAASMNLTARSGRAEPHGWSGLAIKGAHWAGIYVFFAITHVFLLYGCNTNGRWTAFLFLDLLKRGFTHPLATLF